MMGNPGDLSYLPNSSSWGIPTSFSLSGFGTPQAMVIVLLAIVGLLALMHLMKGGRR